MFREDQVRIESMNKSDLLIGNQQLLLEDKDYNCILDLDDNAYFGGLGVSNSQLTDFSKSPRHYYAKHCLNAIEPPTKAMELGTMLHKAVLEPDTMDNYISEEYIFKKLPTKATRAHKDYKEWKIKQLDNHKIIVSKDDYDLCFEFIKLLNSKPNTKKLLMNGHAEKSCYAIDPITKLLLRCKLDYIKSDCNLTDVKSTKDASYDEFSKAIYNFRYEVQASYYCYIFALVQDIKITDINFNFVCLEKGLSPDIILYQLDEAALDLGAKLFRQDLNGLSRCMALTKFDGYEDKTHTITLPSWAWSKHEDL